MKMPRCLAFTPCLALYMMATVWVCLLFPMSVQSETDDVYKKLLIFSEVIGEIEKHYVDSVKTDELVEKAIQGMVRELDPHSAYLTPEEYTALHEDTQGEFSGIGVVLTIKDDIITVISPIEGTPASKAGIRAGDIIVKVNGESAFEMSISEAVNKIKGPKGSRLTLTLIRNGVIDPIDIDLERADIPLESVKGLIISKGYGYVSLSNFNENTTRDLKKALVELEGSRQDLDGLILDLRGNPGGLLDQSADVVDLFLRQGEIVSIKGREGEDAQVWKARDQVNDRTYPLVVLINGGSASASEIVAGALQDHKRALILGTPSFGKGSVQNIKPLEDGSALKLTIARYYTPRGRSIQAQGIIPDIDLPLTRLKKTKKSEAMKEKDLKNHLKAIVLGTDSDTSDDDEDLDTGIVRIDEVAMKKKPQATSKTLKALTKGSQVKIIKRTDDDNWLKVSHGGDTGYIKGDPKTIRLESDDGILNKYGKLDRKKLLLDSQVKRALELLISHRIFAGDEPAQIK